MQPMLTKSLMVLVVCTASTAMKAQVKRYQLLLPFYVPAGCSLQKESSIDMYVTIPHQFARPERQQLLPLVLHLAAKSSGGDTAMPERSSKILFENDFARHYFGSRMGAPERPLLVEMNPPAGHELHCETYEY